MTKNIFKNTWSVLTFLLLLLPAVALTSCGNDDEPDAPVNNDNIVATVEVFDYLKFGQAWYDYFDIKVTLTTDTGTQSLMLTSNAKGTFTFPLAAAPNPIICLVEATPKKDAPAIDPEKLYDVTMDVQCIVTGKNAKGETLPDYGSRGSNKITAGNVSAYELQKLINKGTQTILDFKFIPELK